MSVLAENAAAAAKAAAMAAAHASRSPAPDAAGADARGDRYLNPWALVSAKKERRCSIA